MTSKNADQTEFEKWFYRYQKEPTYSLFVAVIRAVCNMKPIWFAVSVDSAPETDKAMIAILPNGFNQSDTLVKSDGVRVCLIFTKAENAIAYRDFLETGLDTFVGEVTMEKVLKGLERHNARQIVVNFKHETQFIFDEQAVKIAKGIVNETDEANDEQYVEGRKLSNEAMKLYFGTGVKKDKETALRLYEKSARLLKSAAERCNTKAQYDLGLLIRNGKGVQQDLEKAAYWLRQSVVDCADSEKNKIEKMIAQFDFYKS